MNQRGTLAYLALQCWEMVSIVSRVQVRLGPAILGLRDESLNRISDVRIDILSSMSHAKNNILQGLGCKMLMP
jgi:hypothetical protein